MKIGGPEGGGERQGFAGRMREMWKATDFDAIEAERQAAQAQKAEADHQAVLDAQQARYEQSQTPEAQEAREARINEYIGSLDRLGKNRTDGEVVQLLKSTNTDLEDNSLQAEAYARWKEKRAREAVNAASSTELPEGVADLDAHRREKDKEESAA